MTEKTITEKELEQIILKTCKTIGTFDKPFETLDELNHHLKEEHGIDILDGDSTHELIRE